MAFEAVQKNLEDRGFSVKVFAAGREAADYLDSVLDGTSVGIGGSVSVQQLGLYDRLASHNQVFWHWANGPEELPKAMAAEAYLTSVNGLAETGELLNIDGNGNRVASMLYGHRRVFFLVGKNKLAPTYDEALWRARNVAAPKNAQRLGKKTPCAAKADRCYDCKSPDRICRGLAVLWQCMSTAEMEVLLVDEELGY